jgi:isopentenyl diphosphate isomerase/L-lactate dehydrogenase-like FMN-dependent dehydrogenase
MNRRTKKAVAAALNIEDLAVIAKRRLPAGLYEFIDRGAEDEVTMRENAASIKRVFFRQRVGVDVSQRDPATTVFGVRQSMPLAIGVTGLSGMLAYDGERSLARAAAAAGVPYTIGTTNFASLTDLKTICGDLLWRQIYPPKRRQIMEHHLAVTRAAGVRVIVVTMDSPVAGNREYMRRNGFMPGFTNARTCGEIIAAPHWMFGTLFRYMLEGGLPQIADMPEGERRFFGNPAPHATADDFTWEDVRELRRKWSDVLVVKGISSVEDARIAADCGVDGLIVSNHGGRSLDGCVPSMGALPRIVDAVAPGVTVMIDGGFKRGADILKAVAMGASSVMIGRATVFGLAAGGEAGVARALEIFREELRRSLALVGRRNLAELSRDDLEF